ncbi:MAG TPA: hypothetical protein VIP09_02635, partial [Dehalococcoidia bacterium]
LRDTFVRNPGRSAHNSDGIPEQTVTEIRLQEFGPVWPPAFRGTSAGVRFATDIDRDTPGASQHTQRRPS